jgi:hypothetical protein
MRSVIQISDLSVKKPTYFNVCFQYLLHVTTSCYVFFTVVRIQINMRFLFNNYSCNFDVKILSEYDAVPLHSQLR